MGRITFYTVHHLNLCFSSIEEEQRQEVVEKCYWPLLRLAEELNVPMGIEASAYTLECIAAIDEKWVVKLRELCEKNVVEFIGSGYAQLISPLIPQEVNAANLYFGNVVYEKILGHCPVLALINEQAYASGLLPLYRQNGYQGIIMEWENPAQYHPEWQREWRYYPQYVSDPADECKLSLVWNKSIAFQKFQRYAHGDMELSELKTYLLSHLCEEPRWFPLYGNDVEVFDFRPGRYHTEAVFAGESEWARIRRLYQELQADERFTFCLPREVLSGLQATQGGHILHLESPEQPIPVKKQGKYNVTRWAVTGRDDIGINTACWQLYQALCKRDTDRPLGETTYLSADWQELCYLWSSDFRTHITEKRWAGYKKRLALFQKKIFGIEGRPEQDCQEARRNDLQAGVIQRDGRFISIETECVKLRLNCSKGLSIDQLYLHDFSQPLCGTLPHGFYEDISLGADWYSGHSVFELIGQPKVTDLSKVDPLYWEDQDQEVIWLQGEVVTPLGNVIKKIGVYKYKPEVCFHYQYRWKQMPVGCLRIGAITLYPAAFERDSLFYAVANGGIREQYPLKGKQVNHGKAVSFMVSSETGTGITDGKIILGDAHKRIVVEVDKTKAAAIGLMRYKETKESYFARFTFSVSEVDETRRFYKEEPRVLDFSFTIRSEDVKD